MTNWEECWQEMRRPEVERRNKEQLEKEQEQQEAKRRRQEQEKLLLHALADVAGWGLSRYESAKVSSLPVYATWWPKGILGSKPAKRRRQLTVAFPLYQTSVRVGNDSPGEPSLSYHYLLFVASNGRVFEHSLGNVLREVTEVELYSDNHREPKDTKEIEALFAKNTPSIYHWIEGYLNEPDFGIGYLCRKIVAYVGNRVDPVT